MRRLYQQGKSVNGAGINASIAVHQVRGGSWQLHRVSCNDVHPLQPFQPCRVAMQGGHAVVHAGHIA